MLRKIVGAKCTSCWAANYRVLPALSMIHVQSLACWRHATKIHGVDAESTSFTSGLRRVATDFSPAPGDSVGTVDADKWVLVTIKLRVKEERKTTLRRWRREKRKSHSSGRIVRTCQKRAGGDVRPALNLPFTYTAELPLRIYEVIKRRVFLKMILRRAADLLSFVNAVAR